MARMLSQITKFMVTHTVCHHKFGHFMYLLQDEMEIGNTSSLQITQSTANILAGYWAKIFAFVSIMHDSKLSLIPEYVLYYS